MVLRGRIAKSGKWWAAEAAAASVYTQGKSREDARAMLVDALQEVVNRKGFKVTVTDAGDDGEVVIEANEPSALAAYVLKVQRELNGLSLADVAEKLGAKSRNAYARYEQGAASPTIEKLVELLAAVAPGFVLTIEPRVAAKRGKAKATGL